MSRKSSGSCSPTDSAARVARRLTAAGLRHCVVPVGPRYVGCYDGSASAAENYEERCGAAASADLRHWERLSTGRPWVFSPFGTGSVRYLDVLAVDGTWWIYYEMSRADAAHDLRLQRVPMA